MPNVAVTPELWRAVQDAAVNELAGWDPEAPAAEAYDTLERLDGYAPTEGDMGDFSDTGRSSRGSS